MIDSHCHLADEAFAGDLEAVVQRARGASVAGALVVLAAGDRTEAAQAAAVERFWPDVRFAIGVHPHQAHQFAGAPAGAADAVIDQWASTPLARALGEIGLDYHYDFSPRDVQLVVFRAQVGLARERRWPIVIHTREADADTLAVLREGEGALRGVFHCFSGNAELAEAALALGFYISFSGIVTFPKAEALREVAATVPLERLLVETDSPFLSPPPHRGRRNEPARVATVLDTLASVRATTSAELDRATTANFHELFGP